MHVRMILLMTALSVPLLGGAANAAVVSPGSAAEVSPNANCLGAERAERNSAGGDRAQGSFGPGQADYINGFLRDRGIRYGRNLQEYKASGCL